MKHLLYQSTDQQFPVNYLKNDSAETDKKSSPDTEIKTSRLNTKRSFLDDAATLKDVLQQKAGFVFVHQALGQGIKKSGRAFRFLLITVWQNIKPLFIKATEWHDRLEETAIGYFDAFYDFMETFIFMDQKILQPSLMQADDIQDLKWQGGSKKTDAIKQPQAINPDKNKSSKKTIIATGAKKIKLSGLMKKIHPEIKLPLKTTNPDFRPFRPAFIIPVGESLQLILTKCNDYFFRLNPKHLNSGLKQNFEPVS